MAYNSILKTCGRNRRTILLNLFLLELYCVQTSSISLAEFQGDFWLGYSKIPGNTSSKILVITHKSTRLHESSLLDEGAREILRCAQDDNQGICHPERSEGSLAHVWVITSQNTGSAYVHRVSGEYTQYVT